MSKTDPLARIQQALDDLTGAKGALNRLQAVRQLRAYAESLERNEVRRAREGGTSWSRIGSVYGLTKQGAQQRFRAQDRKNAGDRKPK